MIAGQGIDQVAKTIMTQRDAKADYIANTRALRMSDSGLLTFSLPDRQIELAPTPLCYRQIGDRVGIPAKYADRMLTAAPALLAQNVNHWFAAQPEKRMVRTLAASEGRSAARAFLSEKFRPLDNVDIAASVLPKLSDAGCEIKSAAITDTRLYIQAILPKMQATIAKVGDVVHSGVVISNSEVGCGSLWIEHLVYTLRCTNGMIASNVVKKAHVGRKGAAELGDEALANLNKTAGVEIEAPTEVVEMVTEKFNFTDDEAGDRVELEKKEKADLLAKGRATKRQELLSSIAPDLLASLADMLALHDGNHPWTALEQSAKIKAARVLVAKGAE